MFDLRSLRVPIVQAPMAGGPSTPALAAAVARGRRPRLPRRRLQDPRRIAEDIASSAPRRDAPFGVNIFSPAGDEAPRVSPPTPRTWPRGGPPRRSLGDPRFDDDAYAGKVEVVIRERVPVVSFTFGCPSPEIVAGLHDHEIADG